MGSTSKDAKTILNGILNEDPEKGRWLLFHPESDCYFEVFTRTELLQNLTDGLCDDVTDIKNHEDEFSKRKYEEA